MNSFRSHRLRDLTLPTSTAWLLTDVDAQLTAAGWAVQRIRSCRLHSYRLSSARTHP
jgi:hypothetical protein